MMKIIHENGKGGVCVLIPIMSEKKNWREVTVIEPSVPTVISKAINALLKKFAKRTPTDDEWLNFISMKDVPAGMPFEIVADTVIPNDRVFRSAWKKVGGKVEVDMPKARAIHMDRIRSERNKELDRSDKELVRAMEEGVNLNTLKTKRQKLRDIPQNFNLKTATTPRQLKARWPVELTVIK